MKLEEQEKHLNDIITEQDEQQIFNRLQPIIDKWKQGTYKQGSMCIYDLARNCYLTGLIIDAQMVAIAEENEVKK